MLNPPEFIVHSPFMPQANGEGKRTLSSRYKEQTRVKRQSSFAILISDKSLINIIRGMILKFI